MKKITLLILLIITGVNAQNYSRMYSVSNSLSTELTDYQVLIELDTQALISAGKMQVDCDDVRFIPALGSATQLSYWLESGCNTTMTRVWVKVLSIPAGGTDIYLTYGDGSATSESDGEATFMFFDDFTSASLDTSKWNVNANATIDNTIGDTDMSSVKMNLTGVNANGLQSNLLPDNNFAIHSTYYDSGFGGSVTNTWSGVLGASVYSGVESGALPNYSYYTAGYGNTGVARSIGWHYSEVYFSNNQSKTIVDRGAFESPLITNNGIPGDMIFYSWNVQSNFDTIFVRNYEVELIVTEGETLSNIDFDYAKKNVLVYPNPTTTEFTIKNALNSKVTIYNTLGKHMIEVANYDGNAIDVSDFNSGLYYVNIHSEKVNSTRKIMIK